MKIMKFDAKSITNKQQEQLEKNGLADLKCVAQTYDGAAVMSGPTGGVQAHFRRLHPEAIYDHMKDACILIITETWLHQLIPDSAIELAGYNTQRHDRTADSGKSRGGGLCVYVNSSWCTNAVTG